MRALHQFHSALAHAGSDILLNTVNAHFYCKYLYSLCKHTCINCPLCAYAKPIYGGTTGHMAKINIGNDTVYIDTVDLGVRAKDTGVRYMQTRVDAGTRMRQGSVMHDKSSAEAWRVFYHDHILRFGRPRVVHTDQGTEFEGKFAAGCIDESIDLHLSAVGRGASNSTVERSHRDLWPALCCELHERGMELNEWPSVLDIVFDKLNRRVTAKGEPSTFQRINGSPPLFHALNFLKSFEVNTSPMPQPPPPKFGVDETVIFLNPNRERSKLAFRGEDMIVESVISSHIVLLKAC
jgi:transposase InsO family protein